MTIDELFKDKGIKPSEKTKVISNWLIDGTLPKDELLAFAEKAKDAAKASCIEALEFVTKENPSFADDAILNFATASLLAKAPRVKWESARVIGNIAKLFPSKLKLATGNLVENTKHEGTVVRWSAAFALGEIFKLKTDLNINLAPLFDEIIASDEKNSIKKIYALALKKAR